MKHTDLTVKTVSRANNAAFCGLWAVVILLVGLFETELLPTGLLCGQKEVLYYLQTIGVLMALALIPVSLKYFHVQMQKIRELPLPSALRGYRMWSMLRLGGLALPTVFNLVLYYLSMNKAPGFMALITLLATAFCIPGEQRLRDELELDDK